MIKGVIFDCFGVIVGRGFENTYRTAGGDPRRDRKFINDMLEQANLGLVSDKGFRTAMINKLDIDDQQWSQAVQAAEQPDSELLNYVKHLRLNYKTAILSNANTGSIERMIGPDWLKTCFDTVIVSAEVGMVKPDPRIYRYTAEKLDLTTEECIFIDDGQGYVQGAIGTGMQAILYQGLEALKVDLEKLLTNSEGQTLG